jgi:hypothetical protein
MEIKELIAEKDLSAALKVSRATLSEYRRAGLPWVKLGGRVFYLENELMGWIKENRVRVSDVKNYVPKQAKNKAKVGVNVG